MEWKVFVVYLHFEAIGPPPTWQCKKIDRGFGAKFATRVELPEAGAIRRDSRPMSQGLIFNSDMMSQRLESHRPTIISLLPLSPAVQAAPPAATLARIGKPANQPFQDISSDLRLASWTRSIHVFPAAYPRSISGSAVHEAVLPKYPRSQDPVAIAHDIRNRNLNAEKRIESGTAIDEPQLFIAAARYYNHSQSGEDQKNNVNEGEAPITFVLTHANGFHKETWEPMLAHLILSPGGRKIKEFWALDCVNQGDSAVLNRATVGLNFDWADHARDLLNFVLSYLPDQHSSGPSLPMVLPCLECPNSQLLQLDQSPRSDTCGPISWRHRRLGLIGHSVGGCASLFAATSIPELFQDVILVEPVVRPKHDDEIRVTIKIASSTVARQDQWDNRAVALKKFQKNDRFFGRWDPSVLKRYLEHALEFEQPVKLKCNKLHEASVFVQPHNRTSESYFRFSELFDESMTKQPLGNDHLPFRFLLILGNQSDSVVPEDAVKKFGFVKIDRSGHLITQENPLELASLISKHLTESKFPSCINKDTPFCKL
ncbi:uncharacterized protein PGTG_09419 [Puccinia graminis f. sp. tritici CRL 75-36-700-3]|uniref:AB hydrolase-1 domain-containing protein n=1 Tax=Puccinia graminis f. sp. tritici (strain CRL 75-36-700-3 / race SCCL) TaxID=418459 RepID=E3KHD1_PUCGT|nr:uncharacterized protein PGTG_09419 [Puccinia graminis f. sp. tritici CRL 75-36-700-3]EFP83706.2 hypothetical protein PGTG_09419 [Puccinia graminis f. sp. tritici CRL 75-36-700-3]